MSRANPATDIVCTVNRDSIDHRTELVGCPKHLLQLVVVLLVVVVALLVVVVVIVVVVVVVEVRVVVVEVLVVLSAVLHSDVRPIVFPAFGRQIYLLSEVPLAAVVFVLRSESAFRFSCRNVLTCSLFHASAPPLFSCLSSPLVTLNAVVRLRPFVRSASVKFQLFFLSSSLLLALLQRCPVACLSCVSEKTFVFHFRFHYTVFHFIFFASHVQIPDRATGSYQSSSFYNSSSSYW